MPMETWRSAFLLVASRALGTRAESAPSSPARPSGNLFRIDSYF